MHDDLPANPAEMRPSTLSSQGRGVEHREWVLGQIATLLSFYWQPADQSARVTAAAGKIWADLLERYDQAVIRQACEDWAREQSTRPTPAHIVAACQRISHQARAHIAIAPPEEPARQRVAPERAIEMMHEAGFLTAEQAQAQIIGLKASRGEVIPLASFAPKRIQRSGDE